MEIVLWVTAYLMVGCFFSAAFCVAAGKDADNGILRLIIVIWPFSLAAWLGTLAAYCLGLDK